MRFWVKGIQQVGWVKNRDPTIKQPQTVGFPLSTQPTTAIHE